MSTGIPAAGAPSGASIDESTRAAILAVLRERGVRGASHAELHERVTSAGLGCSREHLQAVLRSLESDGLAERADFGRWRTRDHARGGITISTMPLIAVGEPAIGKTPVEAILAAEALRRLREHPEVTSVEQAIALVQDALDVVRPFPEKIEVHDPATFTSPLARPGDMTYGYSLTTAQEKKMGAIRWAVRSQLQLHGVHVRIPDLLLVSDEGVATSIWDDTVCQVVKEDG
jgi:hypothetical protein